MTDAKTNKRYKRLLNRQLLRVSGLCSTPFLSYLPKRSTQKKKKNLQSSVRRRHVGAPPRDTNMAAGNQ